MLKALLRKELLELNPVQGYNKKNGKPYSVGRKIGFALLYIFIYACCAIGFVGMAFLFGDVMLDGDLDWLYFSILGTIAILIGTIVNMFIASSHLFMAKDNEFLLSMPIPSSRILIARLFGLSTWSIVIESIVLLPGALIYFIKKGFTLGGLISILLTFLFITVLVLAVGSFFGFIIALISSKLRNKSIVSSLITMVLLALYYYFATFKLGNALDSITENVSEIAPIFREKLYPLYHMGQGASGNFGSLMIFALISLVLLAIMVFVMARFFIGIASTGSNEKKKAITLGAYKVRSSFGAVLSKEFKRFVSSSAYMLNAGLGLILTSALGIYLIIKAGTIRELAVPLYTSLGISNIEFLGILCIAIGMISCLNSISSPNISLEGQNIWILQSAPIDPASIMMAKFAMHFILCSVPLCILIAGIAFALPLTISQIFITFIFGVLVITLNGVLGLILDIRFVKLDWTNETVPVKRNVSVLFTMFGGWALFLVIGVLGYQIRDFAISNYYLYIIIVILTVADVFLIYLLRQKGRTKFVFLT